MSPFILSRGTRVADFIVDAPIGGGAMGQVYRAHQVGVDRTVALKILTPALADDRDFVQRFRREAMTMGDLEHPSIVTVYAAGESDGWIYLATRLVHGPNLQQVLDGRAPIDPPEVIEILRPLADALDHAHGRGVVHRDIKPANILIDNDGRPFLADFGISKALGGNVTATATGQHLGTPRYMAPEQAGSGGPIGHRADLYALACVAFEMLTGSPLYTEHDAVQLALAHIGRPIPRASERNPQLPAAVDDVFRRGLAKKPVDRFPSARSFVDALETALPANGGFRPATHRGPSRRTVVLAGLGSAALLVAGGTAVVRNVVEPRQQPSPGPPAGPAALRVSAGAFHNLALLADGTVKAWGFNDSGQLGDGTTASRRSTPVTLTGLTGVTTVDAGVWHSMALLRDGTVRIWGDNQFGQLGDGTTTIRVAPVAVPGLTGVTGVAIGGFAGTDGRADQVSYAHTLAVLADGTVMAWGSNNDGQIGDGTKIGRRAPVAVPRLTGVTAVAAGGTHSLGLRADGTVLAWGDNGLRGPTGSGSPGRKAVTAPASIQGLTNVTAVSAGNFHSLALLADGTVRAWGWNKYGQLGDGTTSDRPSPVTVSGLTDVTAIAAGDRFSLALRRNGRVMTWGANEKGQLGDGTFDDQYRAVDVPDLIAVTAASASTLHCLVLLEDGTARAWGWNADGQLGDGTTNDRATPVIVTGFTR